MPLVYDSQHCYPSCCCSELTATYEWNQSFGVCFLHLCTAYQMLGTLDGTAPLFKCFIYLDSVIDVFVSVLSGVFLNSRKEK